VRFPPITLVRFRVVQRLAGVARRCGKCFSLLYWTGYEGKIRVPYGSLIDEPALKPMAHMFVGSKAPWYEILDDLSQHDEYPWS
jgi:hypothetical protein